MQKAKILSPLEKDVNNALRFTDASTTHYEALLSGIMATWPLKQSKSFLSRMDDTGPELGTRQTYQRNYHLHVAITCMHLFPN